MQKCVSMTYESSEGPDQPVTSDQGLYLTPNYGQIQQKSIDDFFFPENRIRYLSPEDNLHEMSNPIFWGK